MEGDNANYLSLMAASRSSIKQDALRELIEKTVQAHHNILECLRPGSEAYDAYVSFFEGYVKFHVALKRYKLKDIMAEMSSSWWTFIPLLGMILSDWNFLCWSPYLNLATCAAVPSRCLSVGVLLDLSSYTLLASYVLQAQGVTSIQRWMVLFLPLALSCPALQVPLQTHFVPFHHVISAVIVNER